MSKKFLKSLVQLYQYFISPLLGQHCRFYPSCSHYALEQLNKEPTCRACLKIAWRLSCCWPGGDYMQAALDSVKKKFTKVRR